MAGSIMEAWLTHFSYAGVVLVLLASGFGLPFPEDVPLITGGYLAAKGMADLRVMLVVTFIAVLAADCTVYWLGRRYGHHIPRLPLLRRYLTEAKLAKAEAQFHRRGGLTLVIARFLPGLRTPAFFTAGVFKIPFWKFLVCDGTAAAVSVPLLVLVGFYGAEQIERVRKMAGQVQIGLGLVGAIVLGCYIAWKLLRRRRDRAVESTATMSPPTLPVTPPPPVNQTSPRGALAPPTQGLK